MVCARREKFKTQKVTDLLAGTVLTPTAMAIISRKPLEEVYSSVQRGLQAVFGHAISPLRLNLNDGLVETDRLLLALDIFFMLRPSDALGPWSPSMYFNSVQRHR